MSLYDDSNPQHLEYLERHRAMRRRIEAQPKWRVRMDDASLYELNAADEESAKRVAFAVHGKGTAVEAVLI